MPGVGRDTPAILWPGRLTPQKDPLLSLRIARAVRDRGSMLELHFVGDGPMAGAVREEVRTLDISDIVHFHPPAHRLADWFAAAHVLLMTSVFEGVPYVIYEAFAMGVPVVAPGLAGNRELVTPQYGRLIDPRDDVPAYAEALVELLGSEERRSAMGAAARRHVLADHGLERMAAEHAALYLGLLDRRRRMAKVPDPAAAPPPRAPAPPEPLRLDRDVPPPRAVGVIVPCYQHGRFLPDCIASIKRQTLPAARIVVVDDGSEDVETREALAALDDDPAVSVVRLGRNHGPSAARNAALDVLDTPYVLPLDADDLLLDDALQTMVAQLEAAPPDVGFVYPNPQHFGNRHDYVPVPEWNLALLLEQNTCAATSLFDARVFAAGVRYPEDVIVGHEDWDLILQLAGRGVRGVPAGGRTFLYRKRGFSRVDLVAGAGAEFTTELVARHPALYADADAIKARWAPALSVVAISRGDELATTLAGLRRQTCVDFEVVCDGGAAGQLVTVALDAAGASDEERVVAGLQRARGRFVLLAGPGSGPLFADSAAVEKLIRVLTVHRGVPAVAFGAGPAPPGTLRLQQLPPAAVAHQSPAAVAWARDPHADRSRPVGLDDFGAALESIVMTLELEEGDLQWRAVTTTAA